MNAQGKTYAFYTQEGGVVMVHTGTQTSVTHQEYEYTGAVGYVEVPPGVSGDSHYILNGAATLKEAVPVVPEVTGLDVTLTGIPSGMLVSVEGASLVADGEPVDLDFDEAGTYTIHLSGSVGYLDTSLEVTVG